MTFWAYTMVGHGGGSGEPVFISGDLTAESVQSVFSVSTDSFSDLNANNTTDVLSGDVDLPITLNAETNDTIVLTAIINDITQES